MYDYGSDYDPEKIHTVDYDTTSKKIDLISIPRDKKGEVGKIFMKDDVILALLFNKRLN